MKVDFHIKILSSVETRLSFERLIAFLFGIKNDIDFIHFLLDRLLYF